MKTQPGNSRRASFRQNLALVLFGLFLGLLLVESGLRLVDFLARINPDAELAETGRFVQSNDALGWVHAPNSGGRYRKICFDTQINFNAAGERDDAEHTQEKAAATYRIVFLGDSFTEALQVDLDETFPEQIEARMSWQAPQYNYESINLGVTSYGTGQEYVMLQERGLAYAPDLVVLAFFMNDVGDNWFAQAPGAPQFDLDEAGNLYQVPDGESPSRTISSAIERQLPNRILYSLFGKLAIYEWLFDHMRDIPALHLKLWQWGLTAANPVDGTLDLYLQEAPPELEKAFRLTTALIEATRDRAEEAGAQFLLVVIPAREQFTTNEEIQESYPWLDLSLYNFRQPQDQLAVFAEEHNINLVSLLGPLRAHMEADQLDRTDLYLACDGHWTARSHQIAAQEISNWIVDELAPEIPQD